MADTGVKLDPGAAKRIVAAVRTQERRAGITPPTATPTTGDPSAPFWARIVGESASRPGYYAWTMVQRRQNQWVERSPRQFDSSCSAVEANGGVGIPPNTVVLMSLATYTTATPATDPKTAPAAAAGRDRDVKSPGPRYPLYQFAWLNLGRGSKYQVLMQLDDAGTVGWDWPRIH